MPIKSIQILSVFVLLLCSQAMAVGPITGGSSGATGSAGGDLSGTYPNPTVAKVNGATASTVGANIFSLTNPSAISFVKIAADNTVSTRTPTQLVSDLGLVIGTNVQAYSANLTTFAGLTLDTDGTLAANSDTRVASQKATKTADAAVLASAQAYTDASIQNFDIKDPVACATTAALPLTPTYSNGSSGVGATLTGTVGVLVLDGYTPVLGDRILVKNQASTFQNGIYSLTTVGTVVVSYVLTRTTDFNQTTNILYGDSVGVLNGAANANQQFSMNNQTAITVGTTAITFAQTSGGSQLSSGNGILITGNSVALANMMPVILTTAAPVTVLTSGTPADLTGGTITIPSYITRWYIPNLTSTGVAGNNTLIQETLGGGTNAAAAFTLFDAAGGTGVTLSVTIPGAAVAAPSAGCSTNILGVSAATRVLSTSNTIFIRQTSNSANAGTIRPYVMIQPVNP